MNILLLHPGDQFSRFATANKWDLIVDLGRAPASTYQAWRRRSGCEIVSLHQHEDIEDLYRIRDLFQLGFGCLVDGTGIDWWDLLSLEIVSDMLQLLRVQRLALALSPSEPEVYASRPDPAAHALSHTFHRPVRVLENSFQWGLRRLRSYRDTFNRLGARQLVQVLQDRFDGQHTIRRRFYSLQQAAGKAEVLFPTAYVNGSRMAVAYAALLPEQKFRLIYTRSSGKLHSLPANVSTSSLSPYFVNRSQTEIGTLYRAWRVLKKNLCSASDIWQTADATAVLDRIPRLLPWAISLRDAWNQVFDRHEIVACLCTDDSNPPSRLPLILAKQRGIPALSCHHGALDYAMAIKQHHEDHYLAKSEMERDYLQRVCLVPEEKIVVGGPVERPVALRENKIRSSCEGSLVFFTEPYSSWGWRTDEVWRELLPRLASLTRNMGIDLVLKLHPFESVKSYQRLLRRYLPENRVSIITGPSTEELWQTVKLVLTVQSSVALECARREVPVFLCSWLQARYYGYVRQFDRFHLAEILRTVDELDGIPELMKNRRVRRSSEISAIPLPAEKFRSLLLGGFPRNHSRLAQPVPAEGVVA